jgi:ribonuclease Z
MFEILRLFISKVYEITIQGYVIYSVRKKLKKQYIHLKGKQIEKLKKSGVEVCNFCNIVLVENFSYWMLILACIFN